MNGGQLVVCQVKRFDVVQFLKIHRRYVKIASDKLQGYFKFTVFVMPGKTVNRAVPPLLISTFVYRASTTHLAVQSDDAPLPGIGFHDTIVAHGVLYAAVNGRHDDAAACSQSPFQSRLERHLVF